MRKTTVRSFAIKQEILDKLKVIADSESRTINNLVCKILSGYVNKSEKVTKSP